MTDSPTRLWWFKKLSEKPCGAYFFAFFEKFVAPILTSGGLAAVSSSFFAALYSAFGRYDVVHIHAEGPAFFCWIPKLFGKRVISTIHGLDWAREKWKFGVGSKFIRQGEKNAVKYADEIIVLSKGVQKYFMETYGRETHFIPNGVNRPQIREAKLIKDHFGLEKDSYILFLGRLVPEKGIRYLADAFKNWGFQRWACENSFYIWRCAGRLCRMSCSRNHCCKQSFSCKNMRFMVS